jgi:hypothetical protein
MRKILRIAGRLLAAVVVLALLGIGFLAVKKPAQRPASAEKIEATRERLARGDYLVNNVTPCLHCHSSIDMAGAVAAQ